MNILVIGYYDDFARFFLKIKRELGKSNDSVNFIYFSLFLSGCFYFWMRFNQASWCSMIIWLKALFRKSLYTKHLNKSSVYKDFHIDHLIRYHIICNGEKERNRLRLHAMSSIDYWEKRLDKIKPGILLLSGDSRMTIEILDNFGKRRNIKTWYFEQGPFGTTILDPEGVNANASIRNECYSTSLDSLEDTDLKTKAFLKREKGIKYKRFPGYRAMDYALQIIGTPINMVPPDIFVASESTSKSKFYDIENYINPNSDTKNVILLILQVPVDINMVYHSPNYSNHYSILKDVYKNLPKNTKLIVREHPLFKGRYEDELYIFAKENEIEIDNKTELYQQMNEATVVVVNNSTVGIEAISIGKSVVSLGKSYYDNANICLKVDISLGDTLERALEWTPTHKNVQGFLSGFLFESLIDGHFRDKDLKAATKVAYKILNVD